MRDRNSVPAEGSSSHTQKSPSFLTPSMKPKLQIPPLLLRHAACLLCTGLGGTNFQLRHWSERRGCICANVCSVFERNVSPWTLLMRRTHLFIYTRGALTGTMTSQISNNIKTDIKPGLIRLITNDAHVACTHTHTVYAHARMHEVLFYHPRQPHT